MTLGPAWEHYSPTASEETPCILGSLTTHYSIQNSTPRTRVLYEMKPAHISHFIPSTSLLSSQGR
jgi:hypothetical protein